MYTAFLSYMCVYVRICAYMCVYVLKCLIFRQLSKIDNISAKIYILSCVKSLQIRKISVPLQKFLEILKAI